MKSILNLTGSRLEVNALFVQPTRWCGLNCPGCYVKDHEGGEEGFHTDWTEQLALFDKFYWGVDAWANQITISVDNLNTDPLKKYSMYNLINAILRRRAMDIRPKEDRPEIHMTFHTVKTLVEYYEQDISEFGLLDMISFSELSLTSNTIDLIEAFKLNGVFVNYNKLIPQGITDWDKEAKRLTEISELVDHIYLVIFKSPMGKERDLVARVGDRNRMSSDIVYIENILKRVPSSVKRKITTDGCLRDTLQSARTGYGCASNVSRFQVWPNGTVSGCPYAHRGSGKIGQRAEDIMENIRQARTRYDFKEICHLPKILTSV